MKANSSLFIKSLSLGIGVFFIGLGVFASSSVEPTPQKPTESATVFDLRCIKLDPKTGDQKTVFEQNGALSFNTSVRDGDVVFTVFLSDDKSVYELVNVEKNMLCTVNKRIEVQ